MPRGLWDLLKPYPHRRRESCRTQGKGGEGSPLLSPMEVCALVPLSPRPILRTLNVSTDALAANVRGEAGELQVC